MKAVTPVMILIGAVVTIFGIFAHGTAAGRVIIVGSGVAVIALAVYMLRSQKLTFASVIESIINSLLRGW